MWAAPFTLDLPPKSETRPQLPQGRDPTNRSFHHIKVTDSRTQRQKLSLQMSVAVMCFIQLYNSFIDTHRSKQTKV